MAHGWSREGSHMRPHGYRPCEESVSHAMRALRETALRLTCSRSLPAPGIREAILGRAGGFAHSGGGGLFLQEKESTMWLRSAGACWCVLVRIRGRKGQKRSPTCLGQEGGFGARGFCRLNRQAMDKPLEHQETWAPKPSRGFLIFLCVRFILSHVKLSSSV